VGVAFQSFNRLYDEALQSIFPSSWDRQKIRSGSAGQDGYQSVIRAIRSKQPKVWQELKRLHSSMMEPIRRAPASAHIVLFSVHDVLHQWSEGGLSRYFSHPDFFDTDPENLWKLEEETELVVAIHDELETGHFLEMKPEKTVQWCLKLFETGSPWNDEFIDLGAAYQSWETFRLNEVAEVPFDEVMSIYRSGLNTCEIIGVGAIEPYGVKQSNRFYNSIYVHRHSRRYAIRRRNWWDGLADTTLLLTTEALTTAMFEYATRNSPECTVYDATHMTQPGGRIELHILPWLKSEENVIVAEEFRKLEELPNLHVICNNGGGLDNHTTYISAKGSNDLQTKDILQIMNFVSPGKDSEANSEYDELQVINQAFGLDNAIRLRHVDLINQAAGRNLGYRFSGRRHLLAISESLWEVIRSEVVSNLRYSIEEVRCAEKRRDKKHNKEKWATERLRRQEEVDETLMYEDWQRNRLLEGASVDAAMDALVDNWQEADFA
jgi:hypothetical protein